MPVNVRKPFIQAFSNQHAAKQRIG